MVRQGGAVLLVEDDDDTRALLARVLAGQNWQVMEAINGRDALDQLARQEPSLILLELIRQVIEQNRTPAEPV